MKNRRLLAAAMVISLSFAIVGCSSTPKGKYANGAGIVVEFNSGKAYLTMGYLTAEGTYKVEGDKVVIDAEGNKTVLTLNSDGSLTGPGFIGRLTKQRS